MFLDSDAKDAGVFQYWVGVCIVNRANRTVVGEITKVKGFKEVPVKGGVQDPSLNKVFTKSGDHGGVLGKREILAE